MWPSLALIGGVDTGFCLGRSCQLGENCDQVTITQGADAEHNVEVQEQVTTDTAEVKKRYML